MTLRYYDAAPTMSSANLSDAALGAAPVALPGDLFGDVMTELKTVAREARARSRRCQEGSDRARYYRDRAQQITALVVRIEAL